MKGYVYKIVNKENNKYYVGSTMNIDKRLSQHDSALRCGTHRNERLQEDYNKFGKDSFMHTVVVTVNNTTREEMYEYEQKLLDKICNETSYNVATEALGGGSNVLKQECYILDLNGNIVAEFDSRTEASKYLGLINSSNLTHTASNPSATVKSKKDNSRYRIVNKDYFEENKDEVKKYDRGMQGLYFYEGDLRTLEYIAKAEGVIPETIRVRILQGKLNERRGQFEMSKFKKYYFEGEILTISEIAKIIGCSGQTVRNRIKEGVIKEYIF